MIIKLSTLSSLFGSLLKETSVLCSGYEEVGHVEISEGMITEYETGISCEIICRPISKHAM